MRKGTIFAAAFLYFGGALLWLANDPRMSKGFIDEYSSLNTAPDGVSLARRYLAATRSGERAGPDAEAGWGAGSAAPKLLTRSIDSEELPRDGVVLRIGPSVVPLRSAREFDRDDAARGRDLERFLTPSEEEWISVGGRLVLAVADDYGPLRLIAGEPRDAAKVFPIWKGVGKLTLATPRVFENSPHLGHAIFAVGRHAVIARNRIGEGDVIFISQPEIFSNERIRDADHLALLQQLTADRTVFFDETVHGIRSDAGMLELMKRWGLGPALVLLVLAVGLSFWRRGKRVGPPEGEFIERRSEAVDLVDSMAQLYDRTLTRREAIDAYREMLDRTVASRLFLRGPSLEAKVAQLLGAPLPAMPARKDLSNEEFQQRLAHIREAFRRLEHEKHR